MSDEATSEEIKAFVAEHQDEANQYIADIITAAQNAVKSKHPDADTNKVTVSKDFIRRMLCEFYDMKNGVEENERH